MGWLLGCVFLFYYQQGDTLTYFADAHKLAQLAYQRPVDYLRVLTGQLSAPVHLTFQKQPRAFFFTKLVSLINIFTYSNYWLTAAYFSLLSFVCSWKLANYLSSSFPQHSSAAAIAFLFYPSVIFWGSGVLKESVAVASIMLIVYTVLWLLNNRYFTKEFLTKVVLLAASVWLLWEVKYYYAGVLLPTVLSASVALTISRRIEGWYPLVTFAISWIGLIGLASLLHPILAINRLHLVLLYNHDTIVAMSDSSTIIHFWNLDERPESFIINVPLAIFSGLFRPLAGEGTTFLQWMAGLENTGLLLTGIAACANSWRARMSGTDWLWVTATITYVVVLGTILAFASPNFGSLVRYRVAFLPFLVFLCLAGNRRLVRWLEDRCRSAIGLLFSKAH